MREAYFILNTIVLLKFSRLIIRTFMVCSVFIGDVLVDNELDGMKCSKMRITYIARRVTPPAYFTDQLCSWSYRLLCTFLCTLLSSVTHLEVYF